MFEKIVSSEVSDIEQFCQNVRAWDLDYHPLSTRNRYKGSIIQQGVSRHFAYTYARIRSNLIQKGNPPPGTFSFAVPGEATRQLWWQGKTIGPSEVIVYRPGSYIDAVTNGDFERHIFSVKPDRILSFADRNGLPLDRLANLPSHFKAPAQLLIAARQLSKAVWQRGVSEDTSSVNQLVENLVSCWFINAGLKPRMTRRSASQQAADKLVSMIAEHKELDQLDLTDLCNEFDISRRSLELVCKTRFNTSPASLVKSAKVTGVRSRLLAASPNDLSVGEVMSEFGFFHTGNFAADYRKMFGETPRDTLRRNAAQRLESEILF